MSKISCQFLYSDSLCIELDILLGHAVSGNDGKNFHDSLKCIP